MFEVNLRQGELRKNGIRVKLTGQPFQILVILLEHPGDLVTREQLQSRLWPSDTFVDFDGGLNAAINRVREALGDSAENPRFVETLPRRGYRFIAPLVDPGQQEQRYRLQNQTSVRRPQSQVRVLCPFRKPVRENLSLDDSNCYSVESQYWQSWRLLRWPCCPSNRVEAAMNGTSRP